VKTRYGTSILAAAVGSALATYFLDREQGPRRRAVLRDKAYSAACELEGALNAGAKDLRNRTRGTLAALRQRVFSGQISDEVLGERVRAKLGRVVMHPGSILVHATDGTVTLSGAILKHEVKPAIKAAYSVPGVHDVIDLLSAYRDSSSVPGLQGGRPRSEGGLDIRREHWAPATRMLVGGTGALMTLYGLRQSVPTALLMVGTGLGLLARAVTNMDIAELLGQRGLRSVDFAKTVYIDAPLEQVYSFWSNFENFPRFMRNVRAVHQNRDGTWHWEVAGPLGKSVHWDVEVTQQIPNKGIAWVTDPGSEVEHAGLVLFQREGSRTRVQVEMTYSPPAGALGHLVAALFGADPQTEMDEDLQRVKRSLETGKLPRDAAQA
jgi:uncharacterized membrane protein